MTAQEQILKTFTEMVKEVQSNPNKYPPALISMITDYYISITIHSNQYVFRK